LLTEPLRSIASVAAFVGSALVGRSLYEDGYIRGAWFFLSVGGAVLVSYGWALAYIVKHRDCGILRVPFLMITYSLAVIFLVIVGRSNEWLWGTNYWYAVHAKMGMAGVLWVGALASTARVSVSAQHGTKLVGVAKSNSLYILAMGFALVFLALSNYADMKRAPYAKAWAEAMIPTLIDPEGVSLNSDGLTPALVPRDVAVAGAAILRNFRLNLYRPSGPLQAPGRRLQDARLLSGWYGFEGDSIWISGRASVDIDVGSTGRFVLKGYVPDVQKGVRLIVRSGDETVADRVLDPGVFLIDGSVSARGVQRMVLEVDRTYVPRDLGINADERRLGLLLNSLDFDADAARAGGAK